MASYPEELCNKLMKNKKIGTHTIIFTNPEAEDLYDQLRINKISKNPFHRETYPGKSKRTTNNKRNTTCKLCGEFLHEGIFDGFELEDTMVVAIHNLLYHPKLIPMFPTKHSISKREASTVFPYLDFINTTKNKLVCSLCSSATETIDDFMEHATFHLETA